MEILFGIALLAACVQFALAGAMWIEVRAFREMNEEVGRFLLEAELAQQQLAAGIMGAIREKAMADQAPEGRAH